MFQDNFLQMRTKMNPVETPEISCFKASKLNEENHDQ